ERRQERTAPSDPRVAIARSTHHQTRRPKGLTTMPRRCTGLVIYGLNDDPALRRPRPSTVKAVALSLALGFDRRERQSVTDIACSWNISEALVRRCLLA